MAKKEPLYPHVPKTQRFRYLTKKQKLIGNLEEKIADEKKDELSYKDAYNWARQNFGTTFWLDVLEDNGKDEHRHYVKLGELLEEVKTGSGWDKSPSTEPYDRVEDVPGSKVTEEIASRKREATLLLKQAAAHAEAGEFESALWRAVDAAGLISFFVHRDVIGMPPSPTGRGFFINKK